MTNMMNFVFNNPTKLLFGVGKLGELHNEDLPGKKALLLLSAGQSVHKNGSYDKTVEELKLAGVEYVEFAKIMENPLMEVVEEGGAFAKENGCDFIVALGGGAVLDSSVAVATMATNPGRLWDYVHGGTGKGQPIPNKPLPIVTIATSSGTGSEMNEWGVICNEQEHEKIGFGNPKLLKPVIAVVDPTYMTTVPPKYTAYQGFDALFHNTEVMMSTSLNIMSEALALSAIENIAKYLPRAVKDGNDLEARERVAYGSTMAGITMQLTSTTAQHSMEHAMSAYHRNLQHGAGLIIISYEFAKFFIDKHACDDRFIKMAKAMGVENADTPYAFLDALKKLQEDCGVADLKMSEYGFDKSECMTLAVNARETMGGLYAANPCEVTDEDIAGIFERSYK
ncbi:iron-containing alcohol dehydrogenase [Enterocloster clostridioformis]|jgi:alcohol dehydrogenase class IV|uniref:iron-containing alcohol dehydrogenase n=1 Tax=Enterocloster clostridioformis TaxID=1531 RepID=UPI000740751C|nr:iron-containing alcohol dehydrogenase [Enterocloster clostridioformis]CUX74391.1 Alcohol dehydrogenase [Clostridium sp. C105KSO14]